MSSLGEEGFFSNLLANCRAGAKEIEAQSRNFAAWVVGDQLRKGAALKAIQVAEVVIEQDL